MGKKGKCKECSLCTKSAFGKLLGSPKALARNTVGKVTVGLFKKKCPVCGHYMSEHSTIVTTKG
jgi:hypothetical protein